MRRQAEDKTRRDGRTRDEERGDEVDGLKLRLRHRKLVSTYLFSRLRVDYVNIEST